jgi:Subtilase family
MATQYLIGKGELLTYGIDAIKKQPGDKAHPYTLAEAKLQIIPQIDAANALFANLPQRASFEDIAVAKLILHPAYLAKTYFPKQLLDQAGLVSIGSRTVRIKPRKLATPRSAPEADTTEIFVAGQRNRLRNFSAFAKSLSDGEPMGAQFAEIEAFGAMVPQDRVRNSEKSSGAFEIGLHVPGGVSARQLRAEFAAYAAQCGFKVSGEFEFETGGLIFLAAEGDQAALETLAQFTLMRVIRPMSKIRAARPSTRSLPISIGFTLPSGEPLSREPKVAILDGGLPKDHALGVNLRRYFLADENADDVLEFLEHGLSVTSAVLFGAIEPGGQAVRPYAAVDHHRVLDSRSEEEDPFELYRTLAHVETVLLSRQYQFINLSLGPDLSIEDNDVHAWTAVIDGILSDGQTLMTVAVGNNGERDELLGYNRIQVPADSVNALAVGAVDHSTPGWRRALYSAKGPGRNPGRRKPDLVAFGGSPKEYFHVMAPGLKPALSATLGTSFASPLALRSAIGIRAVLGADIDPLSTKALLIHGCQPGDVSSPSEVGWGRVPTDLGELITCSEGVARIIYQGELRSGKFLRAPVPLPAELLTGNVTLKATFCYASPVDPQDAGAYTKAGLIVTFRPHRDKKKKDKITQKISANAASFSFFPSTEFRTEEELRADLGKWETVLHAEHTFRGSSLLEPVFDVHYNARDAGGTAAGAQRIRYALVVTIEAPKHPDLHSEILKNHAVLRALVPELSVPLRA